MTDKMLSVNKDTSASDRILYSEIRGYKLRATDGSPGKVNDLLVDDRFWGIRYFVVKTHRWLPGRQVLMGTDGVRRPRSDKKILPLDYSKKEVRNSPSLSEDSPVSLKYKQELFDYYAWHLPMVTSMEPPNAFAPINLETIENVKFLAGSDSHLRSIEELVGYTVETSDGECGHVYDCVLTLNNWAVYMFIIEKIDSSDKSFLPLTPAWIRWVSFEDRAIRVELRSEEIAASPPFEPESMSDYRFERQLYEHYRHCRTRR